MKKELIAVAVAMALTGCGGATTSNESTTDTTVASSEATSEAATIEATDKKEEMKKEYSLNDPTRVNDDTTGKWKLNRMVSATNPIDFAFDYYKNFMQPDEIHFIINFSTKTTTSIQYNTGMLYVRVMEHVDKEEVSAKTLGKGTLLQEKYFNAETGEPYEASASSDVAPVSSDELVAKVTEILPNYITPGAELKSVTMNDKNLSIVVDLTHVNDNSKIQLPIDAIAESSVSEITDPILGLGDEYFDAWDTISLDFGEYGHATFSKSDVAANAAGKYFSYEGNILQK